MLIMICIFAWYDKVTLLLQNQFFDFEVIVLWMESDTSTDTNSKLKYDGDVPHSLSKIISTFDKCPPWDIFCW